MPLNQADREFITLAVKDGFTEGLRETEGERRRLAREEAFIATGAQAAICQKAVAGNTRLTEETLRVTKLKLVILILISSGMGGGVATVVNLGTIIKQWMDL